MRKGVNKVALRLFEHNEKAYHAAVRMMEQYGKAAIVHPTGTGKSYIAFKLIEDNPEKVVIWLSPSEYIGSIIFFVGLTLPRYRFSKPSASLDMNLR